MKKIIIIFCVLFLIVGCANEEHTILFNTDGGTSIEKQIVKHGEQITEPVDPTKEGYIFSGWTLKNKTYNFKNKVKEDLTLDSLWIVSGTAKTCNVTFEDDGKTTTEKVAEGCVVKEPSLPNKDNHVFLGWYLEEETEPFNFDIIINRNITLTAKYKEGTSSNNGVSTTTFFIKEIEINAEKTTLIKGESVQINVVITPDYATDKKLNYTSSNSRVASVSDSGLVKALRVGETTIKVKTLDSSEKTKELIITVTKQ